MLTAHQRHRCFTPRPPTTATCPTPQFTPPANYSNLPNAAVHPAGQLQATVRRCRNLGYWGCWNAWVAWADGGLGERPGWASDQAARTEVDQRIHPRPAASPAGASAHPPPNSRVNSAIHLGGAGGEFRNPPWAGKKGRAPGGRFRSTISRPSARRRRRARREHRPGAEHPRWDILPLECGRGAPVYASVWALTGESLS